MVPRLKEASAARPVRVHEKPSCPAYTHDDATGDDDDDSAGGPLGLDSLFGNWEDTAGAFHGINDHAWLIWSGSDTARYAISQAASAGGWLVAQNAASNASNPDMWSKFEWFGLNQQTYFCQTENAAADEAAALATAPADQTDLTTGCGTAAWTMLTADHIVLEIGGVNVDEDSTEHTVTHSLWTQESSSGTEIWAITQFDNPTHYVIAQNDANNTLNPGQWSRWEWYWDLGPNWWICHVASDEADEASALAAGPADNTNPASSGCNGSGWTLLTP